MDNGVWCGTDVKMFIFQGVTARETLYSKEKEGKKTEKILFFFNEDKYHILYRGSLMSLPLAPSVFAPYQTSLSTVAYPSQQTQYFAQGQSNPPGQTADLIIRNINSIIALLASAEQASGFDKDLPLGITIQHTVAILSKVLDGIIEKFALHANWFSAILPYKGYASMSSTNSFYGQPNLSPVTSSTSGLSAETLSFMIFSKLYAQYLDLTHHDTQINRYTYKFIATAPVTARDFSSTPVTQSVQAWFTYLVGQWETTGSPSDPLSLSTWAASTNTNYYWAGYIRPILDVATTNAVIVEQLIPSLYIISPTNSDAYESAVYSAQQTQFYLYVFTIISILLAKQFRALNLSASKIAMLRDPHTSTFPFADASSAIGSAEYSYLLSFNNFIKNANTTGPSTASPPYTGPFLTFNTLQSLNTVAALDPRNCSADPNRSPGSFQPTILYQKVLIDILTHIDSVSLNSYVNVVNSQGNYNVSQALQTAYTGFMSNLPAIQTDLQAAFAALNPRANIHYGQWPQNMSNI